MQRRHFISGSAACLLTAGITALARSEGRSTLDHRVIACEEHFTISAVEEESARRQGPGARPRAFLNQLLDLGGGRMQAMDAAGVDVQLLSLATPGVQNFDPPTAQALAREANDQLAQAVRDHPERFAGLACFPPQSPNAAAQELARAHSELGLVGGVVHSHTAGEYLDDTKFWAIFEAAEALEMPIYLHPRDPADTLAGPALRVPGFRVGWVFGVETATHALRLIAGGVFDRFPGLQIVLGHMGETLPFALPRIDDRFAFERERSGLSHLEATPGEYFRRNFLFTTSGLNHWPQLQTTIAMVGVERILFAVDYPFEDSATAVEAIRDMPLAPSQRRAICEDNAMRWFGLKSADGVRPS